MLRKRSPHPVETGREGGGGYKRNGDWTGRRDKARNEGWGWGICTRPAASGDVAGRWLSASLDEQARSQRGGRAAAAAQQHAEVAFALDHPGKRWGPGRARNRVNRGTSGRRGKETRGGTGSLRAPQRRAWAIRPLKCLQSHRGGTPRSSSK